MAEKKAKPKAVKAKAEPKPELIDKPVLSVELEQATEAPSVPELEHSASSLAAMARAAKVGKYHSMAQVIEAHEAYLNAVKQGASAPAADVEFVKNHMKYLKAL